MFCQAVLRIKKALEISAFIYKINYLSDFSVLSVFLAMPFAFLLRFTALTTKYVTTAVRIATATTINTFPTTSKTYVPFSAFSEISKVVDVFVVVQPASSVTEILISYVPASVGTNL